MYIKKKNKHNFGLWHIAILKACCIARPFSDAEGNELSLMNLQLPGLHEAGAAFNHLPFAVSYH